ncbi:MAG: hypothetical protein K2Q22_07115, partial [Cytophagales bacterium]|nr:hypothetical protein [Cytophagales bacterium]
EYLFSLDSIFKYSPEVHRDSVIMEEGEVRYATVSPTKNELAKMMKLKNLVDCNTYRRRAK